MQGHCFLTQSYTTGSLSELQRFWLHSIHAGSLSELRFLTPWNIITQWRCQNYIYSDSILHRDGLCQNHRPSDSVIHRYGLRPNHRFSNSIQRMQVIVRTTGFLTSSKKCVQGRCQNDRCSGSMLHLKRQCQNCTSFDSMPGHCP